MPAKCVATLAELLTRNFLGSIIYIESVWIHNHVSACERVKTESHRAFMIENAVLSA